MSTTITQAEADASEWTSKFAWLPTKTHNGFWVWLRPYLVKKVDV